jgi:predicted nucleotidyltransferase component of viral defense system
MATVPLAARLKRRANISVALAQDILVAEAYDVFPDTVLHGGTAIWRCYQGGRFSEDVDVYLPTFRSAAGTRFARGVVAKGLKELKYKVTETTVFAKFEFSDVVVGFDGAVRAPPAAVVKPYETVGGGFMLVNTLPPEELIAEKVAAYDSRRKVRDLYDIFFLLGLVEDRKSVVGSLAPLLAGYRKPEDEAQLRALVMAGTVPSADDMIESIRRWARRST